MGNYVLSIIIPTSRYSPTLIRVLKYFREISSNDRIEIVISSTTDNPGNKIYKLLCGFMKNCKLLTLKKKFFKDSRSLHKNIAIYVSGGKYVYVIDDDLVPTMKLIRTIIKIVEQGNCDAILHSMIPLPISIWAKVRMFEKMCASFDLYQSSCRIIKRELFIKLGGYREDLVLGEDIEFQHRLLKSTPRICVIPLSSGFELHYGEYKTLKEYVRRAWYYGKYANILAQRMNLLTIYKAYIKPSKTLVSSLGPLFFIYLFYKYTSLACIMLQALLTQISNFLNSLAKSMAFKVLCNTNFNTF